MRKSKFRLSTTHIILFSFLATILLGSLLLHMPISSADGSSVSYWDALFTATTSTCVTGLVTVPTVSTWSTFGQVVILILIQIGGLGVITIMSGIMLLLNKKMGVGDRLLIQDAFNLNTMAGLASFVKKVLFGTLLIEGIGALLYMIVFVPEFGARGIWISVFTSISAFCNAGIDILAENSLCNYATNTLVLTVTSLLIILGGIGYIVWWDLLRVFKKRSPKNKKIVRHLTLHSKIALSVSLGLILIGAILIFFLEHDNPQTMGGMNFFEKLQASLFQSVTTRTAGFAALPQESLRNSTAFFSMLLMIVGGSPVGTAGGIKTITLAVLVCYAWSTVTNKNHTTLYGRRITEASLKKAVAVVATFLCIWATSTLLLLSCTEASTLDVMYETVSATATVGLTRNLTPSLNALGKVIVIFTMYLGRVGPISLAVALGSNKKNPNIITEPTEEVSIG